MESSSHAQPSRSKASSLQEIKGDLWEQDADALVITTNGFVKRNGAAVMGRGVALQAAQRYPWLPAALGSSIETQGNHVTPFLVDNRWIITFPVKHKWYEKADLLLIERSRDELVALQVRLSLGKVVLPRPGCGNGGLDWEDVKPIMEVLDEHFFVIDL